VGKPSGWTSPGHEVGELRHNQRGRDADRSSTDVYAGKTTFYAAHLKEAFPTVVPPIPQRREAMLRERRSFAIEDLVVDTELLESARQAGYRTKVLFISTEDPNLNVGRILVRMSRGGQAVPLSTIPDSYREAMKSLPGVRQHTKWEGASARGTIHRRRVSKNNAHFS
jgi:hypothetical protein